MHRLHAPGRPLARASAIFALLACTAFAPVFAPGLPFHFVPNVGQVGAGVRYVAEGDGYDLLVTDDAAVFALHGAGAVPVRMRLQEGNPHPRIETPEPLPGRLNFATGEVEPWLAGVPAFAEVHVRGVYEGVDLVYYGTERRQVAFDFVLQPGASPGALRYRLEGADDVTLDDGGNLVVTAGRKKLRHRAPAAYQPIDGAFVPVEVRFVLEDGVVSFAPAAYDARHVLVLTPVAEAVEPAA